VILQWSRRRCVYYYPKVVLSISQGVIQCTGAKYAYGFLLWEGQDQGFGLQAVASVKCPGGPSTRAYGVYGGLDPASCAGFSYAGYFAGNTCAEQLSSHPDEKLNKM